MSRGEKSDCMGTARRARRVRSIIGSGVRPPRAGHRDGTRFPRAGVAAAPRRFDDRCVTPTHRQEPSMSISRRTLLKAPPHRVWSAHPGRSPRLRSRPSAASMVLAGHLRRSHRSGALPRQREVRRRARVLGRPAPAASKRACGRGAGLVRRATAGRGARRRTVVRAPAVRCAVGGGPARAARRCRVAPGPVHGVRAARAPRAASPSVRSRSNASPRASAGRSCRRSPQFRVADRAQRCGSASPTPWRRAAKG